MKNIMVILSGRRNFGDLVCYIPTLMNLKQAYPNHKLLIVSKFSQAKLLLINGVADEHINYKNMSFLNIIRLTRELTIDVLINFNSSSFFINKFFIPILNAKEYRRFSFKGRQNKYIACNNLSILKSAENKKGLKIISELSSSNNISTPQALTFLPGGGGTMGKGTFKRWHINNFINCAKIITEKTTCFHEIIFILGSNEYDYIDSIPKRINDIPVNIAYNLSIGKLIELALKSKVTVANDCGPSHIFHMLNCSMVSLFAWKNEYSSPYLVIKDWFLPRDNSYSLVPPYPDMGIESISVNKVVSTVIEAINFIEK